MASKSVFVVMTSHYNNWDVVNPDHVDEYGEILPGIPREEIEYEVDDDEDLSNHIIGVFTSLKEVAKACHKFNQDFIPSIDMRLGPIEGIYVSMTKVGTVDSCIYLGDVGVRESAKAYEDVLKELAYQAKAKK